MTDKLLWWFGMVFLSLAIGWSIFAAAAWPDHTGFLIWNLVNLVWGSVVVVQFMKLRRYAWYGDLN